MKLRYNELLSHHTSFKIGGEAWGWLEAEDLDDMLEAIEIGEEEGKPIIVFGSGSNILVQDKGFDGIVIHLNKKGFGWIEREDEEILDVGAATQVNELVKAAAGFGLSGCEFLIGIPGNFGGAVFMNAGVRDVYNRDLFKQMGDIVMEIDVFDIESRKKETIKKEAIGFMYRSVALDNKIILGGRLGLKKEKGFNILRQQALFIQKRTWMKELRYPTAGSIFKNPEKAPAGRLIEECGLKGKRIGNAKISELHANFIVNLGNASAGDVLNLIKLARESVRKKFGIDMELEIKVI